MDSNAATDETALTYDVPSEMRSDRLWGYFLEYKWWFLLGAGFLVLTNLQKFAVPLYIGYAVELMERAATETAVLSDIRTELVWAATAIILLAIGAAVARILSRITIFNPGRYIEFNIRNDLYHKLTELTPAFFDPAPTGDVTSRVTNDVKRVRTFYALTFLHVINTAVAYTIGIWRMTSVDWELTLICLAPYPFLLVGILWVGQVLFHQEKRVQAQLSELSSKVQENLGGMSVVKAFAMEDHEREHFGEMNQEFFERNLTRAHYRGGLTSLVLLVTGIGTVMLLLVGTPRVVHGDLALGKFVEFNGYVVALAFPTTAMGWVFSIWHRGRAAFDRIMEILAREPALDDPDPSERRPLPSVDGMGAHGRIDFDGVTFGYGEEPVLHDLDLRIPAGSTVAMVGKTGSGKSTLVRLMTRLYNVDRGEVRIDDVPVDRVPLRRLRSDIGFVPQDPLLFSMTLRQNIRFGLDALEYDPTIERTAPRNSLLPEQAGEEPLDQERRIEQAVDVSGLRPDVVSFSDGLETVVGERGVTLSGGQKQRVTLARALLVDPRVLILDDALSSVDTETEQVILDHLDYVMEDRTSILLTHRFNALDRVDRIFVLEEGRIVERGTHHELLAQEGAYAQMYRRQQLQEDLDQ